MRAPLARVDASPYLSWCSAVYLAASLLGPFSDLR